MNSKIFWGFIIMIPWSLRKSTAELRHEGILIPIILFLCSLMLPGDPERSWDNSHHSRTQSLPTATCCANHRLQRHSNLTTRNVSYCSGVCYLGRYWEQIYNQADSWRAYAHFIQNYVIVVTAQIPGSASGNLSRLLNPSVPSGLSGL